MATAKKLSGSHGVSADSVIKEVSALVSKMSGIQLGEKQYPMVENRLKSRMLKLQIQDPFEYLTYLKSHLESESQALLSLMTTHHTYFFREFAHFEFLIREGLAKSIQSVRQRGEKVLRVWSAAASRGQEVYSLAMFLDFHLKQMAPEIDFEIWGTDVDPQSIKIAENGVYPYKELKQVPSHYLGQNWSRGTGEIADYAKIKSALIAKCKFGTFNLTSPTNPPSPQKFDWIFCRNVYIYFNTEQIKAITKTLMNHLHETGFFFIGVSETLNGMGLPYEPMGPSIYRHEQKTVPTVEEKVSVAAPVSPALPELIRVLCVDDSPSILTLLKRVLSKDNGFEVVATAANGKEAMEALKLHKVDVMTLDIHMPEMDGITYLQKNMNSKHPPVLMLSSVNRENATTALKSIELGAADYVEKPTMANLMERGDEIRSKLKTALLLKNTKAVQTLDSSFKRDFKISDPDKKLRIIFAQLGDKKKMSFFLKNLNHQDPATIFVFEGALEAILP
ncbi:MAG: CheR family methyltransferase, partial [Pseudobdellovibrionaceae bacterium]